jgi:hypothetical protein
MTEEATDFSDQWAVPINLADHLSSVIFPYLIKYEKKNKSFLQKHNHNEVYPHEVFVALMIIIAAYGRTVNRVDVINTFISVMDTVGQINFIDVPDSTDKIH